MELKTDSTLLSIENRVSRVNINVKKMNLDSLYLFNDEWQDISLESCSFRSLDIRGKKLSLKANQVKAINYYEELGTIRSSEISDSVLIICICQEKIRIDIGQVSTASVSFGIP